MIRIYIRLETIRFEAIQVWRLESTHTLIVHAFSMTMNYLMQLSYLQENFGAYTKYEI